MPKEYVDYELWLGSFEGEKFKWKRLNHFNDFEKAYEAFKKFVKQQVDYSDEELLDVWESPRLDIELRQADRLINWVGIYTGKQTGRKMSNDSFGPRI